MRRIEPDKKRIVEINKALQDKSGNMMRRIQERRVFYVIYFTNYGRRKEKEMATLSR